MKITKRGDQSASDPKSLSWKPCAKDWIALSTAKIGPVGAFKGLTMPTRKVRRLKAKMARAKKWTKGGVPVALAFPRPDRGGAA